MEVIVAIMHIIVQISGVQTHVAKITITGNSYKVKELKALVKTMSFDSSDNLKLSALKSFISSIDRRM